MDFVINFKPMKTSLLFFALFFVSNLFGQRLVYLCQGQYSYAFHSKNNCAGLINCRTSLIQVSEQTAKYNYRRQYCCRCWSGVQGCYDDSQSEQKNNSIQRRSNQGTFTPDYQFYSNALDRKQSKYDANKKVIENAYGRLLSYTCINKVNQLILDESRSVIVNKIKNQAGYVDWSINQNVQNWLTLINTPFQIPSILAEDKLMRYLVSLPEGSVDFNAIIEVIRTCNPEQISNITIHNYNQIKKQNVQGSKTSSTQKPNINLKPGKIVFYSPKSNYNIYSGTTYIGSVSPGRSLTLTKDIYQNKTYKFKAQKASKFGNPNNSRFVFVPVYNNHSQTNVFLNSNNKTVFSYQ